MRKAAFGLLIACTLAGCISGESLDQVHAGMTKDQVMSVMGEPPGWAERSGRDCAAYSVLKDFWRRVPWDMSERYYVCYADGKVERFGRADQPEFR